MKLTVLGYWGAYPEKGEATAGYLLQTKELNMLIDCGSGVLAQLFKYIPIEKLDAVFLSHYHHDHVADLGCLQYATMIARQLGKKDAGSEPLPIYGHTQAKFFLKLKHGKFTVGKEIKPGVPIELKGLKVEFLPTVHEEYNLGMRFEYEDRSFVYTGDTGFTKELIPFIRGSDLILTETSLYANQSGQVKGHLTSLEAGQLANEAGVKQLVLTHFPHYGDVRNLKSEAQRAFHGSVELASTGKVFGI